MMRTRRRASGFTMIELLIVIVVIAILIALLMPVLATLRKKARTAATESRIQQVTLALTHYLDRYPTLGYLADSTDFMKKPYQFLHANYRHMHEDPLIELPLNALCVGPAPYTPANTEMEAEQMLDCFTGGPALNVLQIKVVPKAVLGGGGRTYTETIFIRSTAGTPQDPKDDIVWCYTVNPSAYNLTQSREWFELKGAERDPILSAW